MKLVRALASAMLFLVRRIGPGEYLGRVIWLFIVLSSMRVDRTYALPLQVAGGSLVVGVTSGRLFDAGFSRYWACLILPTIASPWLFPALFPGERPMGILIQIAGAISERNPYQIGLVAALLVFPLALGFTPTLRLSGGAEEQPAKGTA
jgi:hypothetical protein